MIRYRFGKHPPKSDYRSLRFSSYVKSKLAAPPASWSVLDRVYKSVRSTDPSVVFPMDGNDQYGDCTIAAAAHATTVYRGMVGKKSVASQADVTKTYFHLSGGTDSGLVEMDVLNYWRKTGIAGEKILAFMKLDPKNHVHVQQAMSLFGGVYLGFQVPTDCMQQFNAHKTWTPGPLTHDGHAVYAVSYDARTVSVLTWGAVQKAEWAWWDECVDEAYALLPADAKAASFDPGFNFKQLMADLNAVAS